MTDIWFFVAALAVVYLLPGPDMVLILQTSVFRGRTHAIMTAVGFAFSRAMHVFLASVGLAAILRTSPWLFELVRFAGAAYIVWLGIVILRTKNWLDQAESGNKTGWKESYLASGFKGFLTSMLNPKTLLFCSVILPQLIRPNQGGIASQFLLLGLILVGIGMVYDLVYAGVGATFGKIARLPKIQNIQRWVFGILLIGFGMRLAFISMPI